MRINWYLTSVIALMAVIGIVAISLIDNEPNAPKEVSTNLHRPFEAKAVIKQKDLTINADLNKTDIGKMTMEVVTPTPLKGMKFQYDGKDITVSYMGMSVELSDESPLVSTITGAIVRAIDTAASPSGIDVELKDKALLLSGDNSDGKFFITLDKESGALVNLQLPELDLECIFDSKPTK